MDIAGTKQKLQRMMKVAEESYKKMSELLEKMERLQTDLETTSNQVNHIEYDLAEQRALIEAIAENEGIDIEAVMEEADLPPEPAEEIDDETQAATSQPAKATSRPASTEEE